MPGLPITFTIQKKLKKNLGRAGILTTPHGDIQTPAFVTVGTKATVKSLTTEQVAATGAQVVLANTYHLYLEPGQDVVQAAGGIHKFMNWSGPTMTDSGGFQAFSLGAAYGLGVSKVAKGDAENPAREDAGSDGKPLAKVTEDGVSFRSPYDGSEHLFTPERSIEIQHGIGADIIFAFDECTSPRASYEYQKEALARTHRWAKRSLDAHKANVDAASTQALFGIVQGGRFEDLRKESADEVGRMDFDGFGIGGSFDKEDMNTAVAWVNSRLPENKPRHLLGIGEPLDLFGAVENGCDLFDCVSPTRLGRTGGLYTQDGRINIFNAQFTRDLTPIDPSCECYTCKNYTKSYLAHLYRSKEMLAATLGSIHNLTFIIKMVDGMREAILNGNFEKYRDEFLTRYYGE